MKINLVGGFLGSGKTTAIINSSNLLINDNIRTSIITNDQGDYLVDSRFVQNNNISYSEVTGGCFCCNYNQLDSRINSLIQDFKPAVLFAETVGSCTDLVATVLKPLIKYRGTDFEQITFTTFVDSQLLFLFLKGNNLPFSSETNYIWEKQVEEAEILVINKIDLLTDEELKDLREMSLRKFPDKELLFQNSLNNDSIQNWLKVLQNPKVIKDHKTIEVDYNIYGKGEANLAWLDEEIQIITENGRALEYVYELIKNLTDEVVSKRLPVGHFKFFLAFNEQALKLSYTTILNGNTKLPAFLDKCNSVDILVNARIQTTPDNLREIFIKNLEKLKRNDDITINETHISFFQPGFPNPTHRMS